MNFAVPADHRLKRKEGEKGDKYLDLGWDLKKLWNMKVTVLLNVIRALGSYQRIGTGIGGLVNKRASGDHPNYSIAEISKNTKKNPGDLRTFADTQTPVE